MHETLIEQYSHGDRLALSRLLSMIGRDPACNAILDHVGPPKKPSRVVAFTGSGGVGKSTLIGKLIELLRRQSRTVAVLACDPKSPLTGGALLGDRFRMPSQPDDGIFIRSLAAATGDGAVIRNLEPMIRLVESFGFDVILIETVGAGQGDIAVHALADVVVLLLQPETGDDLQWEKAGILELADVLVLHKADLPGSDRALSQLKAALELSMKPAPLVRVSAKTGAGIEELWQTIQACPLRRGQAHSG